MAKTYNPPYTYSFEVLDKSANTTLNTVVRYRANTSDGTKEWTSLHESTQNADHVDLFGDDLNEFIAWLEAQGYELSS